MSAKVADEPRPERRPAAMPAAVPSVTRVAFTKPVVDQGLTLALPLVRTDTPLPDVAVADAAPPDATEGLEIRYIRANSVNVREGPSTDYPVIGRLTRGEAALVLWTEDNGWAHVTIEGDGIAGYVSGDLLSPVAP